MPLKILLVFLVFPFSALAQTCDLHDRIDRELPAKKLLQLSRAEVKAKHFCQAAKLFQETILQHPQSKEAKNAQLEIISALAGANEFKEAIRSAKEFLVYFPRYQKKEELLHYIKELEVEEQRYASRRRLRWEDASFGFSGLPPWPSEPRGYVYPGGEEPAIGAMGTVTIPF